MHKLLIATPISHIDGLDSFLKSFTKTIMFENTDEKFIADKIKNVDAIYINPNKSKVYYGEKILKKAKKLKVICTASTGTNHIDLVYAKNNNITILSLTKQFSVIKRISSTAELATTLSLMAVRNTYFAINSVKNKNWNYESFIGRQTTNLSVGVVGYGRLGKIYANHMLALGSEVYVYDPYVKIKKKSNLHQLKFLEDIFIKSDVISLHVHADQKNLNLIDNKILKFAKKDCIIINTSRGEIINENHICTFLKQNPNARLYVDVLADEIKNKFNSPIYKFFKRKKNTQICITPHIGGMTKEGQLIAYFHAAKMLKKFLNKLN